MSNFDRRAFLRSSVSTLAYAGLASGATFTPSLAHAAEPGFSDYKALVVLFLHGGNDSFNMLVPTGAESVTGYQSYKNSRAEFAVRNNNLGDFTAGSNPYAQGVSSDAEAYLKGSYHIDGTGLGVNSMMPELAQLLADKKAAMVSNVGTMVEPLTKQSMNSAQLPPFLFAHNHQQRALETGWADNLAAAGWAGRMADQWGVHSGGVNGGSPLGLNVAVGGHSRLVTGRYNSPVVLRRNSLSLFDERNQGFDSEVFKQINDVQASRNPLSRVLRAANSKAVNVSDLLAAQGELDQFSGLLDPYGNPLFSRPSDMQLEMSRGIGGSLLASAQTAAKIIAMGRNNMGLKRQIVFINMGGFDTHANLLDAHPRLLRELSLAIWNFQQAMAALNIEKEVSLMTLSDFGRSLGNNGSGSDHGWAGNQLLVGGALQGGNRLGDLPDYNLGGDSDVGAKGRMIPNLAADQYLASVCDWFGVDDEGMGSLFPNLANFKTAAGAPLSSAYLADMFA